MVVELVVAKDVARLVAKESGISDTEGGLGGG